jgi:hypothetical protein
MRACMRWKQPVDFRALRTSNATNGEAWLCSICAISHGARSSILMRQTTKSQKSWWVQSVDREYTLVPNLRLKHIPSTRDIRI